MKKDKDKIGIKDIVEQIYNKSYVVAKTNFCLS